MKEVLVHGQPEGKPLTISFTDSPIPTPGPNQVVIRNVVVGTNPKDWKIPFHLQGKIPPMNTGDDVAGYIHSVGEGVTEFHKGDRVAAFHEMMKPHGAFAEYTLAHTHTTFHLPPATTFEEGATIPLAAMTAAVGLYARLGLPEPWALVHAAREPAKAGVIVYGAASAVGAFVIKLLKAADVHPILAVAGNGIPFVEGLLEPGKGDVVVDYRKGDEEVVKGLKAASKGEVRFAYDAVSEKGSYENICRVLSTNSAPNLAKSAITLVLPGREYPGIPDTITQSITTVGSVHGQPDDLSKLGHAWFRLFGQGLREGWFSGHLYQVVKGGLAGVAEGLNNLKDGKASAVKYVYRVAETEGVGESKI